MRAFLRRVIGRSEAAPRPTVSEAERVRQELERDLERQRDTAERARHAAVRARREQEEADDRRRAERAARDRDRIEQACAQFGAWFPGDAYGASEERNRWGALRRRIGDMLGLGG